MPKGQGPFAILARHSAILAEHSGRLDAHDRHFEQVDAELAEHDRDIQALAEIVARAQQRTAERIRKRQGAAKGSKRKS